MIEILLLYHAKRLFLSKGIDYVGIDLRYMDNIDFMSGDHEVKTQMFNNDLELVARVLVEESINYDMIIMAVKSMGTTFVQRCLKEPAIVSKASVIHMTPGTAWRDGIEQLKVSDLSMLLVGSTVDSHYRVENLHDIYQKKNLTLDGFIENR